MTVLIAGAGIAGLTLGLSLYQVGVPFKIFESVKDPKPLGVGINLQPHAVRELFDLGLARKLDVTGLRLKNLRYVSTGGKEIWSEPRGRDAGYDWPQYSVHRGWFQMMLMRELQIRAGNNRILTGAAVSEWSETENGVEITLIDKDIGSVLGTESGSVLVAADGINSAIRAKMFPREGDPVWGGTMMWRGVSRGAEFLDGRSMIMAGCKARKFVVYPISEFGEGQVMLNWIADLARPQSAMDRRQDWSRDGRLEDFADQFADWNFEQINVPEIIRTAENIYEYPMVDRDPLPFWVQGRALLIGDAAHAMYPIGSNGASQAIIDARVLAAGFAATGEGVETLLNFQSARREKVNALVLANRGDGPDKILDIVAARAPQGFSDIDAVMPFAERKDFADQYKKIAGMDVAALNGAAPTIARPPASD